MLPPTFRIWEIQIHIPAWKPKKTSVSCAQQQPSLPRDQALSLALTFRATY